MRKLLLLIVVFFVLTGFNNLEIKMVDSNPVMKDRILNEILPPSVKKIYPSSKITAEKGKMVMFGIDYVSMPSANVVIKKEKEILKVSENCSITMTGNEVRILLKNLKLEDSGQYSITLENGIGETSVWFNLVVVESAS